MDHPINLLRTADAEPCDYGTPVAGIHSTGIELTPLPLTGIGVHLEDLAPGDCSCVLHAHLFEEELFYVVDGVLTVRELAPETETYREFALRAGELVAYPAGTRIAHQFVNRSAEPARFVAISDKRPGDVVVYPDSGKVMLRGLRSVGAFDGRSPGTARGGSRDAEETVAAANARAALRPVEILSDAERPSHVTGPSRLGERALGRDETCAHGLPLACEAGAKSIFVNRDRLPPGARSSPLHWHTANEEIVVVLTGRPSLRQRRGHRDEQDRPVFDGGIAEHATLRPGDVLHWSPREPVAHQIINEADHDALLLVIGDDQPEDVCVYPERGEVYVAALEQVGPFATVDYWVGETPPIER